MFLTKRMLLQFGIIDNAAARAEVSGAIYSNGVTDGVIMPCSQRVNVQSISSTDQQKLGEIK